MFLGPSDQPPAVSVEDGSEEEDAHGSREPDGSWTYTNRLVDATSPYLLQHAHNPVEWYPWGPEALERARREDKAIFLSVGYSTCYWCHVMKREVFSDPEIAALMNEQFINVKVDREERPDLDEIYMTATYILAGRGGWPNSVFLTPDLEPFYAGTYFGPRDGGGRPGFPSVIRSLSDAWAHQRGEVLEVAERVSTRIAGALGKESGAHAQLDGAVPDAALSQLMRRYDARSGGFGTAPKFPQGFTYPFIFAAHERTGDSQSLDAALDTLRRMAAGGFYDHVGGGFHRYATDGEWRVPHFEKMLYNQAQLARAYVEAYRITGDAFFADVARDIFRYVDGPMTGPDGQFYSALDAETDAVEGAYYVWNRVEIEKVLSADDLGVFDEAFALAELPRFPGHKHPDGGALYMRAPLPELASSLGKPYPELRAQLDAVLRRLEAPRASRKLPRLDDKVIAGWNGLMIDAYAFAGAELSAPRFVERAESAARFVLDHLRDGDGDLLRIWRRGEASQLAFLEDYAFVLRGLLSLHDATGKRVWLDEALRVAERTDALFWDDARGGYFVARDTPDLIARSRTIADSAIPSGNSAMVHNLLALSRVTDDRRWRDLAERTLEAHSGALASAPSGSIHLTHALELWLSEKRTKPLDEEGSPPTASIDLTAVADPLAPSPAMDSSRHVRVSATAEPTTIRVGSPFRVVVRLAIDDGWHVNANPASLSFLIPTVVDVRAEVPLHVSEVAYPEAVTFSPEFADVSISVYEGQIEMAAMARLDGEPPESGGLTVRAAVSYQACSDATCLAPAEEIVDVSLRVVP